MAPLFGSKKPKYPSQSKWTVLKGLYRGHPVFARRNDSAEELMGSPEYQYRIGVAAPLLQPDERGFPSHDEMEILNQIEDQLCAVFERDQMSLQVLAVTTNGVREFVFYSRDTKNLEPVLDEIRAKFSSHKLQSYVQEDKQWGFYRDALKGRLY